MRFPGLRHRARIRATRWLHPGLRSADMLPGQRGVPYQGRRGWLQWQHSNPKKSSDITGVRQWILGSKAAAPLFALPPRAVSYTHLRAHETGRNLVCRLLLEKKK